ncbi:protein FAM133B-like [Frankliniella occidentalis]|uniref:Protein FAM133B-like n=1 Tax=Frankliniella occidentalis TaxID=133901 RepID=A0A9C6XSN2_FRAOC|nr:protein FAM133B-like [Frankliniella occidentalis]
MRKRKGRSHKKSKKSKRSRKRSTSDSSSESEDRKKRRHRKKSRRHVSDSSSSDDSSSSSSSSSSDSSESSRRKRKSRGKKRRVTAQKRNSKIYEPCNYLCSATTPGAVKLQEPYEVYIKESDLNDALSNSGSVTQFIRQLTPKVYTQDALVNATPLGYSDRSKGRKHCGAALPRLHPDGRSAILGKSSNLI